jgi:hypothetical protein
MFSKEEWINKQASKSSNMICFMKINKSKLAHNNSFDDGRRDSPRFLLSTPRAARQLKRWRGAKQKASPD